MGLFQTKRLDRMFFAGRARSSVQRTATCFNCGCPRRRDRIVEHRRNSLERVAVVLVPADVPVLAGRTAERLDLALDRRRHAVVGDFLPADNALECEPRRREAGRPVRLVEERNVVAAERPEIDLALEPRPCVGVRDRRVNDDTAVHPLEDVFDAVESVGRRVHLGYGRRRRFEFGQHRNVPPELLAVDVDREPPDDALLLESRDAIGDRWWCQPDVISDLLVRTAGVGGEKFENLEIGFVEVAHERWLNGSGKECTAQHPARELVRRPRTRVSIIPPLVVGRGAMTNDDVTDLLTEAYIDELETVMNYLTNGIVLDGVHAEEVKQSLEADVDEELEHARLLGNRLKQLDQSPPGSESFEARQSGLQPPEDTTDVQSVIDGVLEAEEEAMETYRSLLEAAEDANDPVTEDVAVTILADEEAHHTEFRGFKKEFPQD
jgi:bacterioferritin